jgi:putative hemolysin
MALVTDEFGGIEGIVTHDDILEDIVGDFPLAGESIDVQATRREDGSWLVDGLLPIDELVEILDLENWPEEELGDYHTVGGFVLKQVQSIPSVGDGFVWNDLRFEVVDMDGRRVDKVLISAGD